MMKKFRVLLAIIALVAMLSTVTFAAESSLGFGASEISYTKGENLVVSVYANIDATLMGGGYLNVSYDKAAWKFEGFTYSSNYPSGEVYEDKDYLSFTLDPMAEKVITKDAKILDIEFSAIDENAVAGTSFSFVDDECFVDNGNTTLAYSGTLTVKAAAPAVTKYTVTFDTDGGSAVASQEVEEGKFATVPENPTKDGYTFKGWDKDIATTAITGPTTFTAQWEKNAPTPVVPTGSGSVGDVKVGDTTYTNVYTGEFSATPAAGTKFTKIGAIFYPSDWESKEETYKTEHPKMDLSKIVNFEGTGVLTFKAAIVGVPDGVTIVSEPYTVSVNK